MGHLGLTSQSVVIQPGKVVVQYIFSWYNQEHVGKMTGAEKKKDMTMQDRIFVKDIETPIFVFWLHTMQGRSRETVRFGVVTNFWKNPQKMPICSLWLVYLRTYFHPNSYKSGFDDDDDDGGEGRRWRWRCDGQKHIHIGLTNPCWFMGVRPVWYMTWLTWTVASGIVLHPEVSLVAMGNPL